MVKHQLPKLRLWVRFPSPAPKENDNFRQEIAVFFCTFSLSQFSVLSSLNENLQISDLQNPSLHNRTFYDKIKKIGFEGHKGRWDDGETRDSE